VSRSVCLPLPLLSLALALWYYLCLCHPSRYLVICSSGNWGLSHPGRM
jgi:hypothetical protein